MRYDPRVPIAVFLGPSLPLEEARALLPRANYYPPVRQGDLYRLLAAAPHTIVIVDGVFHGQAAIWHREILEAIDNGVRVVGASSMGALRAAELAPYGMIGVGGVFAWYRDGFLVGDDEVALLHADADHHYRPFSLPLVNVRHALQRAVAQAILTEGQADSLIRSQQRLPFTQRNRHALLSSSPFEALPEETRTRLAAMLGEEGAPFPKDLDLKRLDAIAALTMVARSKDPRTTDDRNHRADGEMAGANAIDRRNRFYRERRMRQRGFLAENGTLIAGAALLAQAEICLRSPRTHGIDRASLVTKGFLIDAWPESTERPRAPDDVRREFADRHLTKLRADGALASVIAANGITRRELDRLLVEHADVQWLREVHGPARIPESWRDAIARVAQARGSTVDDAHREFGLMALLLEWADFHGIAAPEDVVARFTAQWRAQQDDRADIGDQVLSRWATSAWLLTQTPAQFGYRCWRLDLALVASWQFSGEAARRLTAIDREKAGRPSGTATEKEESTAHDA
ncbi:TfuA domain-containing protein [Sulfidibacter corallicola]|uniref:TfuA-like core domain-containing protein n=1 Tax=Sulfidibacter corallicola TaxID=2818388 RepID=A0A8A4THN0_SULCO|nr:TfuA-like protein [Sulfidibacter corallicola]QTD48321.1 hypothetical protein J3U87_22305 [Sulfidibacter corallicola]